MRTSEEIERAVDYNRRQPISSGDWKSIQRVIGAVDDGIPGAETARAVMSWQCRRGLVDDGKVGPLTLSALLDEGAAPEEPPGRDRNRDSRRVARDEGRALFIDISTHQGRITWPTLATWSALDGVLIKSTHGRDFVDPLFEEHWRGAGETGVARGAYHVASMIFKGAPQEPLAAAQDHFEAVGGDAPLLSWLDLETSEIDEAVKLMGAAWTADYMSRWLEETLRLSGREAGLYWSHRGVSALKEHAERFRPRLHWWALYYNDKGDLPALAKRPPKPAGWPWALWQFTSSARVVGIGDGESDVDLDVVSPEFARQLGIRP